MKSSDSPWTLAAAVVVALAALAGLLLDANIETILVFLIGGIGAVLLAAYPLAQMRAPARDAPDSRDPDEAAGLLDALPDPVLLVRHARILFANRAALGLLGSHIVGEDVRTGIRHPAAAEHLRSDAAGEARGIELLGLGGRDQRWLMRISDLGDGRRLVHLSDHSQAHAAERMRVDFVANASHELRTPLAAILGFIETLDGEAGGDPTTRSRFLDVMMREARRMQTLVDDLISLSRIEADKHRAPEDAVDLGQLAQEVARVIGEQPASEGRSVELGISPAAVPVAGDATQLSQLLHNVIGNAIKYGRAGTPVKITLEPGAGGMMRLTVADEGEGIEAEHLHRLTERFYRVDSGRSRAMGGTGLGLSIVKHIVERHRGKLDIASTPGTGTTFTITLPAAP